MIELFKPKRMKFSYEFFNRRIKCRRILRSKKSTLLEKLHYIRNIHKAFFVMVGAALIVIAMVVCKNTIYVDGYGGVLVNNFVIIGLNKIFRVFINPVFLNIYQGKYNLVGTGTAT